MIAQKVKSVQDGIDSRVNDNLYCLSDLAQAIIREFADVQTWQLTALSTKVSMPKGIFAPLRNHAEAQKIADKQYVPEEVLEGLDDHVRASLKTKKRKSDRSAAQPRKKPKTTNGHTTPKAAKTRTPKKSRAGEIDSPTVQSAERRRSGRQSTSKNYAGMDESEDEEEDEE